MNTIGFAISGKENERRRALLPQHLHRISNPEALVFEKGYATHFGISDSVYLDAGCRIGSPEEVYSCNIVCNPKTPQADERERFGTGQTLFGWIHAVQSPSTVDFLLQHNITAIAWEDMFIEGRHTFWRNNEIAGEAAILHAINYLGRLPAGLRVALVGLGNCARGAHRLLSQLGTNITIYDRRTSHTLCDTVSEYDIVVNAVLWDVFRKDHLLTVDDVKRMRQGSMIIDISCDEHMGIETSRATPIYDPVYEEHGVIHYVVDHTPALYWNSASVAISDAVSPFFNELIQGTLGPCLQAATIVRDGTILDDRIVKFQNRSAQTLRA